MISILPFKKIMTGEEVDIGIIENEIQQLSEKDSDADEELKGIFLEESEVLLARIRFSCCTDWRSNGKSNEIIEGIRREFHTLKGSSSTTGYHKVSRLSHAVESLIEQDDSGSQTDDDSMLNLLEEMHDGLASELGILPSGGENHLDSLIIMVELLLNDDDQPNSIESELEEISDLLGDVDSDRRKDSDNAFGFTPNTDKNTTQTGQTPTANQKQQESGQLSERESNIVETQSTSSRIENRKLSELLNFSGELGLTRTQLKNTLDDTRVELDVLRDTMRRIRDGLRDLEFEADAQMKSMPQEQDVDDEDFDPLQLDRYSRLQARAREVNQQLDVLTRVERQLNDRASDMGGALIQQLHLGEQLQDGLVSARMVSINDYIPRLRQSVREASRRSGKTVELNVAGVEIEVDRQVMDTMMAPFEHMIRNSIFHGIESNQERLSKGKSENGAIGFSVNQQGSDLIVQFRDDGRGLNRVSILKRAAELGIENDYEDLPSEIILQIISEQGYSTAESVSIDSGRGGWNGCGHPGGQFFGWFCGCYK